MEGGGGCITWEVIWELIGKRRNQKVWSAGLIKTKMNPHHFFYKDMVPGVKGRLSIDFDFRW